jgi:hypothetical protein
MGSEPVNAYDPAPLRFEITMQHYQQTAAKLFPVTIFLAALLCLWNSAGYPQPSNPAGAAPSAAEPAANPSTAAAPQASPTPAAKHKHKRKHHHHHNLPNIPPVPPPGMP